MKEVYHLDSRLKFAALKFRNGDNEEYFIRESVMMDLHEYNIFNGKVFFGGNVNYAVAATTGYIDLLLSTGDLESILYITEVITNFSARLEVWSGVTTTDDGTEISLRNRKESSDRVCSSHLYVNPSGVDTGSAIKIVDIPILAGSTTPAIPQAVGVAGGTRQDKPNIALADRKYYMKLSNLTASQAMMAVAVEVGEIDDLS